MNEENYTKQKKKNIEERNENVTNKKTKSKESNK